MLLLAAPAFGDAGMWTFHDFPAALVKREHGVDIDSAWLDRVRTQPGYVPMKPDPTRAA